MCDRNGGRRLRQWLIEQIDSSMYPGLIWENDEKSMFRIPWKHAGKQDYNQEVDASIFKVKTPARFLSVGTVSPFPHGLVEMLSDVFLIYLKSNPVFKKANIGSGVQNVSQKCT